MQNTFSHFYISSKINRHHHKMCNCVLPLLFLFIYRFGLVISNSDFDDNISRYEVWASDQSNTVPGQTALGISGSYLWIFDSLQIEQQLQIRDGPDAKSEPCTPGATVGPCDIRDIFPTSSLMAYYANNVSTGTLLESLPGFGRMHGVVLDPTGKYVVVNLFAPGGGYTGVIDTRTREAVALFRVTSYSFATVGTNFTSSRSVHMSFWNQNDGSSILISNLNGKAIERINVKRNHEGDIVGLEFDRSATLGLGRGMSVADEATVFYGLNAFGRPLIGSIIGEYRDANLGDSTPRGYCKENGCGSATAVIPNGSKGGRPNNLPICPISSTGNFLYITLTGGGLFVADITKTPIQIVAEYGNQVIYGAGCGGAESLATGIMYLNAGNTASAVGATESMFAVWGFVDKSFATAYSNSSLTENMPAPIVVYQDETTNTLTGGNLVGTKVADLTGQLPYNTTRRDSHGMDLSINSRYLHVLDRIQNKVEVFDLKTATNPTTDIPLRVTTYDLTSRNGQEGRTGRQGACFAKSVLDDPYLPLNDPAGDLFARTPDGKYLMIGIRGPAPVTVNHSTQGSCPGVGIVRLLNRGRTGRLKAIIRTTNTIPDNLASVPIPGGHTYTGRERSDVHAAIVVPKK